MSEIEKVALVTGGSRGIGRAIVIALAQAGWEVVFSYHQNAQAAEETAQAARQAGREVLPVQADIAEEAGRERLVNAALEAFGGIDLLVNNAGIAPRSRVDLLEMTRESFDEVMDTNLKGPFFLTQRVARVMIEQARALQSPVQAPPDESSPVVMPMIINIGSISAYASSTNRGEYCLSKAGVSMMTALFADRLAGEGILVYEVRPGIIMTDMTAAAQSKYDRLIQEGLLPIRRWGMPEDIARAVTALAGGALPYSTGEVINVDGGFHLRRL